MLLQYLSDKVDIWEPGAPITKPYTQQPYMSVHLAPKPCGKAVLVCPGGGYAGVCDTYEGEELAPFFNSLGISIFVLRYRHAPLSMYPKPMEDASEAMAMIRANAAELKIDPGKIGIMGFSAGGHLASVISTLWDKPEFRANTRYPGVCTRPDFSILVYPVINLHRLTRYEVTGLNLLGPDASEELIESFCSEKNVTPDTPPAFLFSTCPDDDVPLENSLRYFEALRACGVPGQLHIYDKGPHGIGFGAAFPQTAGWPEVLGDWLENSI
ncbi:MAG: alpha/beta hydrolase [Abditibacteriota bacterium]|nr:alpha/beta hydrolase [Abditibacteriota bacterium]